MSDDIARLIGAVTREVRNETYQGKQAKVVVASRVYETGIDDLWDAITNPRAHSTLVHACRGRAEARRQVSAQGQRRRHDHALRAARELALTWEFGPGVSWVEVSLREEGESTRLELRHIAHPEAHWEQFGPGAVGIGWELGLMGLDRHLADPSAARPPEGDEAWMMSPDAKRFVRLSAEGWGHADIAGGAQAAHALESAERTRKFYSGET